MKQLILPIRDSNILHEVENTLLHSLKAGRRDYTISQVGEATLFRVSSLLTLRHNEIFNNDGTIVKNVYIRNEKTEKPNTLHLKPVKQDLKNCFWRLNQQNLHLDWLLPSAKHPDRHITEKQFYRIMARTGDLLGINYLGTRTMREAGAYRIYTQTYHNIGLVMSLLNHSPGAMTLKYLGLDQISRKQVLGEVKFG